MATTQSRCSELTVTDIHTYIHTTMHQDQLPVCHWLLQCSTWDHLRQPLLEAMDEAREDFLVKSDGDRTVLVLSFACSNYHNYVVNKVLLISLYIVHTSQQTVTLSLLTTVSLRIIRKGEVGGANE